MPRAGCMSCMYIKKHEDWFSSQSQPAMNNLISVGIAQMKFLNVFSHCIRCGESCPWRHKRIALPCTKYLQKLKTYIVRCCRYDRYQCTSLLCRLAVVMSSLEQWRASNAKGARRFDHCGGIAFAVKFTQRRWHSEPYVTYIYIGIKHKPTTWHMKTQTLEPTGQFMPLILCRPCGYSFWIRVTMFSMKMMAATPVQRELYVTSLGDDIVKLIISCYIKGIDQVTWALF